MTVPRWYRRPLYPGDTGPDVNVLRRILGLPPGPLDEDAFQRIRGVRMARRKAATAAVVDAETAALVGDTVASDLAPTWFQRDLQLWFEGEDVRIAASLLGLGDRDNRYTPDVEAAVRRLQSANGIEPNGVLGFDESKILGDI